jgi:nitroreductase
MADDQHEQAPVVDSDHQDAGAATSQTDQSQQMHVAVEATAAPARPPPVSEDPLATLRARYSCRDYAAPPSAEQADQISSYIAQEILPPFGNKCRLVFLRKELGFTATYGVVGGSKWWLAGAVPRDAVMAGEDYGYVVEHILLRCTALGLGTVWLGGTFSSATFSAEIALEADKEKILAVSPVGVARHPGFLRRLLSNKGIRQPIGRILFDGKWSTPVIDVETMGPYADCAEAVRLGPSALNKQPWRILRRQGDNNDATLLRFHFYDWANSSYSHIDLGIAMAHWEIAAQQKNLPGHWEVLAERPELPAQGTRYVVTWVVA